MAQIIGVMKDLKITQQFLVEDMANAMPVLTEFLNTGFTLVITDTDFLPRELHDSPFIQTGLALLDAARPNHMHNPLHS